MKKMKIEVFEPPMCCSSGVCEPNVNPELERFSRDLEWLKTQNVDVIRYSLSSNPAAFASQESVKKALDEEGNECLPLVLVNGCVVSKGVYPSKDELMGFMEIKSDGMTSVNANESEVSKNNMVCGPECDCGKPSKNTKAKAVVFLIVLSVICGIFVYKTMSMKQSAPANTETAFAIPTANQVNEQAASVPIIDKQEPVAKSVEDKKRVGAFLDSLSLLNKVAVNQDAVFVFIPAKEGDAVDGKTTDAITSAEQKMKSDGIRLGLYTLQPGSPEYANIAAQLTLPSMLVMSKGRGMAAVSGEITETKLLQAYVASSRAGGCCPSGGAGSPGCK